MRTSSFPLRLLQGFLFLGISLGPALVSSAGTIDPNTPDSRYVEFGKKFPYVVRFVAPTEITVVENGAPKKIVGKMYASAVVVAPNWALTAAHVLTDAIGMPTLITDTKSEHPVDRVIVHEKFNDTQIGYFDIALCHCPQAFALEFYPALYTQSDETGKAATIAGYGTTGTFLSGNTKVDGLKRGGHNRIDNIDRGVLICTPSRHNRFPLEFCITPGDSGGGLFIGNELAGINSFLMSVDSKPDGSYGDEAAFTRVSLYVDWVHNAMQTPTPSRSEP
jgi:hypothetical protein